MYEAGGFQFVSCAGAVPSSAALFLLQPDATCTHVTLLQLANSLRCITPVRAEPSGLQATIGHLNHARWVSDQIGGELASDAPHAPYRPAFNEPSLRARMLHLVWRKICTGAACQGAQRAKLCDLRNVTDVAGGLRGVGRGLQCANLCNFLTSQPPSSCES